MDNSTPSRRHRQPPVNFWQTSALDKHHSGQQSSDISTKQRPRGPPVNFWESSALQIHRATISSPANQQPLFTSNECESDTETTACTPAPTAISL